MNLLVFLGRDSRNLSNLWSFWLQMTLFLHPVDSNRSCERQPGLEPEPEPGPDPVRL